MSQTSAQTSTLPTDVFWAAVPREQLADAIRAKALAFRSRLDREGKTAIWRRAERTYYGRDSDGGYANSVAVTYGGDDGEVVCIRINHYRSIIQGLLATAAKERPAFDAIATSSDSESLAAVALADAIIEYYYREAAFEEARIEADRMCIVLGEAYTALRWNPHAGKVHVMSQRQKYVDGQPVTEMVEQAQEPELDEMGNPVELPPLMAEQPVMEDWPEHEGDVDAQVFGPIEVVRDLDSPTRDLQWACIPYRENVWDLAARFPEHAPGIIALRGQANRWPRLANEDGVFYERPLPDDDAIDCWHLYAMPTSSLPQGRYAQIVGDIVLHDGPMELPEVPVYALIPEREMRRATGYSPQFDLLALQEAYDATWDTILSAHDAFGLQNVLIAEGSNVKPELLARGLQGITYKPNPAYTDGGVPRALSLLAIPAASFDLLDRMQRLMETLSGINSVVRGDPMPQLKSGAALALVQSLAVAFNSQLAGAVTLHDERVATGLLRLVQKFAITPRTVEVVGKANARSLKSWNASALKGVQRVAVQVVSPLLSHTAGKMEIADKMWSATKPDGSREITTAQYFEILTTGRMEPIYQGPVAAAENIGRENEMLSDGKPVQVVLFDDHCQHATEHTTVLASPEARQNPQVRNAVTAHINEHLQMWLKMDPALAMLTGQSKMPPPPPMAAPPPGDAPPNGKPGAPPAPGKAPAERAKPLGKPGGPEMPMMPVEPLSGQRVPA